MHSFVDLLLYFFLYSLVGWIWESSYVSVKEKKPVNRGFLHGPILPIYGSGAVVMLTVTEPFTDNIIAAFFAGMAAATLLEYITGVAMETLFKVRYWDYTGKFMNFQGQICLVSSITWGVFTIILTRIIQPPVQEVMQTVSQSIKYIVLTVLILVFSVDFVHSFKTAMDFRRLLEAAEKLKSEMVAMYGKVVQLSENAGENLQSRINSMRISGNERMEDLQNYISSAIDNMQKQSETKLEDIKNIRLSFNALTEKASSLTKRFDSTKKHMLKNNPMLTSKTHAGIIKNMKEKLNIRSR